MTDHKKRRYPYRIPIRMTHEERRLIGQLACAVNLSVSRYLVESSLTGRAKREKDRARLQSLLALFEDTGDRIQRLLLSPLLAGKEAIVTEARTRLEKTLTLLVTLGNELRRRLE